MAPRPHPGAAAHGCHVLASARRPVLVIVSRSMPRVRPPAFTIS
jgi:hypothetical protein